MARLSWMNTGSRFFETGVGRGVLYVAGQPGVAWTGLTSVDENPSGGDPTPYYLDGVKYLNIPASEEFEATISAYTYPREFGVCDGSVGMRSGLFATAQPRKPFGFSYKTRIGNDIEKADYAYKIHIVYNAIATPSNKSYKSLGGSIDTVDFKWDITTTPPKLDGYKNTAHIVIDTRYVNPATIAAVEDVLYGTELTSSRLPDVDELLDIFDTYATFGVIDHGDGSFTVSGPTEMVHMISSDVYELVSDSAVVIDSDSYSLSSL
jgi:hypothetical protein